jgi:predicted XRE-type DNA-binding protein
MTARRSNIEMGSGNIFADLGLPDPDEMLLKSKIAIELDRVIKQRNLTHRSAAKLAGISQPDFSRILRGQFQGYSQAELMRILRAFG